MDHTEDEPTSIPAKGNMERDVAVLSGENNTEREYNNIYQHYLQDKSVVRDVPEFPAAVQYQQMSKASILERLAHTLRHYSRLQRDLETVQTETDSLMLPQGFEHPSPTTTGTAPGPFSAPHGIDGSSPEVENICFKVDACRRHLQQITEQLEAERSKTAASEEKRLKMQEDARRTERRERETCGNAISGEDF